MLPTSAAARSGTSQQISNAESLKYTNREADMVMRIEWGWQAMCVVLVTSVLAFQGCTQTTEESAGTADAAAGDGTDLTLDPMAALSPEDQALVAAQKKCPVGGELGSMGTPVKVDVDGRTVFICCEHCREPLLADPEKYLAKLDAQAADEGSDEAPAEGEGTEGDAASEESSSEET